MEHAASERLVDRIEAFLGYPAVDPHGDPIPRADGSLAEPRGTPLSQCPGGQRFRGRPGHGPGPGFPPLPDRMRPRPARRGRGRWRTAPSPAPSSAGWASGASPSACRPRPRCWCIGRAMIPWFRIGTRRPPRRARGRGGRATGRAGEGGPGRGRPRARPSPGRAAGRLACGRRRRSGCDSRGRSRCRAACRCCRAEAGPGRLDLRLGQHRAEPERFVQQVANATGVGRVSNPASSSVAPTRTRPSSRGTR